MLAVLATLKIYIKTNLAHNISKISKFFTETPISFMIKLNKSFRLWKNYQNRNNKTVKNWYILLFIAKSMNRL